jgi:alkanesulfonate monooxygenase SsuD/methylene tetrahydromethanopterin reductase-like flavin-dependent oxidoreductase (luciferase family)
MIKRFHALYVGQIALDNIGLGGTPANERRYSNERLSEVFRTARDVARLMDQLGYYALWTAEHHFQREGYECFPNLVQLGLWLATQTRRLKFGCAFNILPMWHPIRLAEDYAMADIVTDGRVIMGVGRGYHTREVESFGAPLLDADANRAIFEEGLELREPAAGALSRLHAQGDHDGAAAEAPAGRGLDADRQRPHDRPDGAPRAEGDGDAERRKDPRRRGPSLSSRLPRTWPAGEARRGHDLGRRNLPGRQQGRGDPPGRAVA